MEVTATLELGHRILGAGHVDLSKQLLCFPRSLSSGVVLQVFLPRGMGNNSLFDSLKKPGVKAAYSHLILACLLLPVSICFIPFRVFAIPLSS